MSQIRNVASILNYQYTVDPSQPKRENTNLISDDAINIYQDPIIDFENICTPHYVDIGDDITMTYTAYNNSTTGTPVFSTVSVQDDMLIIPQDSKIVVKSTNNVLDYDFATGIFNIQLPGSGLTPGSNATAQFVVTILPGFDLTTNLTTNAIATFTTSGSGATTTIVDSCGFTVNNATLSIDKSSSVPEAQNVSVDQPITYTIVITNTGNQPATIPTNGFVDPLPLQTVYADNLSPANFGTQVINGVLTVTNTAPVTIPAQVGQIPGTLTVTYTVKVVEP